MSTKPENSGWKFKWYSSFHRKVSENDGNPQTYSSFPVKTEMTGKSCTICKLPLDPAHFDLFSRLSTLQMQQPFQFGIVSSSLERLGPGETPHRGNPVPLRAFHSNRIFRANDKMPGVDASDLPRLYCMWCGFRCASTVNNLSTVIHSRNELFWKPPCIHYAFGIEQSIYENRTMHGLSWQWRNGKRRTQNHMYTG